MPYWLLQFFYSKNWWKHCHLNHSLFTSPQRQFFSLHPNIFIRVEDTFFCGSTATTLPCPSFTSTFRTVCTLVSESPQWTEWVLLSVPSVVCAPLAMHTPILIHPSLLRLLTLCIYQKQWWQRVTGHARYLENPTHSEIWTFRNWHRIHI